MKSAISIWLKGLSPGQILLLILCIIVFLVVVYVSRKIVKLVVCFVVVLGGLIYFGLLSPKQIYSSAKLLLNKETYAEIKSIDILSNSIRVTGNDIEVMIKGTWYKFDDITKVVSKDDGSYEIKVNNTELEVDDAGIESLIKLIESN